MKHKNHSQWNLLFIVIVILIYCFANTTSAQTTLSAEEIAEKALAATVYLKMKDSAGKTLGIGSGFFVKPNIIATNYHVIEGASKGTAKLVGKNTTYRIEGVTATDKTNDLALLKVTAFGIKPLILGDSDSVKFGSTCTVVNYQEDLEDPLLAATVDRIHYLFDPQRFSLRDAIPPRSNGIVFRIHIHRFIYKVAIPPRSSGIPVFDNNRSVIGIYVSTPPSDLNLGLKNIDCVIPVNFLKILLKQSGTVIPFSKKQQSTSAETYYRWGYEKQKLEDFKDAIVDYNIAIRLNPDYTEAFYNRGKAKFKLKKYFDAISDFDTAIRLKPDCAEAYNYRGLAKVRLGEHAFAIADFDITINLKPDYFDAYTNRGLAKFNLKQYSSAIDDYDRSIELNSRYAPAYYWRGGAKTELGQHFEAISDIDTFIRLMPNNAEGYILRGSIKSRLGHHNAAVEDFERAIQIQPNDVYAYYARGLSKSLLGQTMDAKQDLQKALKLAEKAGDASLKDDIKSILQKTH